MIGEIGSNRNIAPYNTRVQGFDSQRALWAEGAGWPGADDLGDNVQRLLLPTIQFAINEVYRKDGL